MNRRARIKPTLGNVVDLGFLDVAKCAVLLGVTPAEIDELIDRGLPYFRYNGRGRRMIERLVLDEFLARPGENLKVLAPPKKKKRHGYHK